MRARNRVPDSVVNGSGRKLRQWRFRDQRMTDRAGRPSITPTPPTRSVPRTHNGRRRGLAVQETTSLQLVSPFCPFVYRRPPSFVTHANVSMVKYRVIKNLSQLNYRETTAITKNEKGWSKGHKTDVPGNNFRTFSKPRYLSKFESWICWFGYYLFKI